MSCFNYIYITLLALIVAFVKIFLCQNANFLIIFRFSVCKFVCLIFNIYFCLSEIYLRSYGQFFLVSAGLFKENDVSTWKDPRNFCQMKRIYEFISVSCKKLGIYKDLDSGCIYGFLSNPDPDSCWLMKAKAVRVAWYLY